MIVKCRCGKLNIIEIDKFGEIKETGRPIRIGGKICEDCRKEIVIYVYLNFPYVKKRL